MDIKSAIVDLLKSNPKGLMAKDIVKKIPSVSKKEINQVLYRNSTVFVSVNYSWFLRSETQYSKNIKGENLSINRIEILTFARNIFYLKENERDELLSLSGAAFKNLTNNIYLLKKAKSFRYLRDFTTFKKFVTLPNEEFCKAFYNAMVLGYGYKIRHLTDAQWLTFIMLPKQDFISALNHAIELQEIPQLQNLMFSYWFDMIQMKDSSFTFKMSTYAVHRDIMGFNYSSRISTNYGNNQTKPKTQPTIIGAVVTKCMGSCSSCKRDVCIEMR